MILFTSHNCSKCQILNDVFNLQAAGIDEITISDDNVEALVELAWNGLIDEAKKNLPILLDDDGNHITDMFEITQKICERITFLMSEKFNKQLKPELQESLIPNCVEGTCVLH
jgi:hypothetical protein